MKINLLFFLKTLFLLCLAPFFILSFFNHPAYDDFAEAVRTASHGYWGAQKDLYVNWTGRYFSSFLLTLANPLTYDWANGVRVTPVLFLLGIWGGVYALFRWLTIGLDSRKYSGWFAGAILLVYLSVMPNVFQGFYWFTGAVVYQTGNLLLLLLLVGSYQFMRPRQYGAKWLWGLLTAGSAVGVAATNEIALLQLLMVLGLCLVVSLYQRRRAWRWWSWLLLLSAGAALLALLAPGNFVRVQTLQVPNAHSLVYSVPRALFSTLNLLSSPAVWFALLTIVLAWLPWGISVAKAGHLSFLRLHPLLALAGILAGIYSGYFPFWWLSASYTPPRTENAIVFYLLISWLLAIQATLNWQQHRQGPLPVLSPSLHYGLVPIFGLLFCLRMATVPALLELVLNARKFDTYYKARYILIENELKKNHRDLTVEPLLLRNKFSVITDTTIEYDLEKDARADRNRVYAAYFGLDSIRIHPRVVPVINTK